MKVLIGAGGWTYFKVPRMDSLRAYSKAFGYVEVNSTFYSYPQMKTVESWRKRVPESFVFSVRCHQDLTHRHRMEPTEGSYRCLDRMVKICRALSAPVLHLQTPSSLRFGEARTKRIGDFLSSVDLGGVRLAWEIRLDRARIPQKLFRVMHDANVVHSVDLSRELPAYNSDIVYTRLFGKGVHNIYQLTDEELEEAYDRALDLDPEHAYFTMHGPRMYKDAARLAVFKQTGEFPLVTNSTGLRSLEEVLREDARFPCAKEELIRDQGWKLIDLTAEKRVRAKELLDMLPDRKYADVTTVLEALKSEGDRHADRA